MALELFQGYPDVMSVQQITEALGIGKNQAYALINSNAIKHVKIGRKNLIPKPYLIDFLQENKYNCNRSSGFQLLSGKEIIAL